MNQQNYLFGVVLLAGLFLTSFVNCKPSSSDSSRTGNIVASQGIHEKEKVHNDQKAFISYRRSYSKHLAMLTKVLLSRENISTYMDVEDLEGGYWDDQIKTAIVKIPNFIILLSNGTLDRCIGDTNYTDVLHQEIKMAVDNKRNIVPVFDDYTHPKVEFSPEINEMMRFQGVEWNHSLVNATIYRLIKYLKDEKNDTLIKTKLMFEQ